jgi:hypothetical protein
MNTIAAGTIAGTKRQSNVWDWAKAGYAMRCIGCRIISLPVNLRPSSWPNMERCSADIKTYDALSYGLRVRASGLGG